MTTVYIFVIQFILLYFTLAIMLLILFIHVFAESQLNYFDTC